MLWSEMHSQSLTGLPGDVTRGRALAVDRASTCILCHSGPFPEQKFQGDLAPGLAVPAAAGPKASFGFVSSTRPASMLRPSCRPIIAWTALIASARRGATNRSYRRKQIEDLVAYLTSLRE